MVQDAYPIGDWWLHGLLRYLLDHQDQGLVAIVLHRVPLTTAT